MAEEQTTVVVQRYLDALARGTPAEPVIRELLDRAARRLQLLCTNLLYRSYPRRAPPRPTWTNPGPSPWPRPCRSGCGSPPCPSAVQPGRSR